MNTLILSTKLYAPPTNIHVLRRLRLHALLDCMKEKKLMLVSAPAGFGKTELLSEWLSRKNESVAWLSLDEEDGNEKRFLNYIIAALQTISSEIGQSLITELGSPRSPPWENLMVLLMNDIHEYNQKIILVLDDYHRVCSSSVDEILAWILEHMPTVLKIVLVSRKDPNVSLARLRAANQIGEIRSGDLRFSLEEVTNYFRTIKRIPLSNENISLVLGRTEGWIAGMQLAAISMVGKTELDDFVKTFVNSTYFVTDYLIDEVLNVQDAEVKEFLLATSILDRMNESLCKAVLNDAQLDAACMLKSIQQDNLFLIPLDKERQWFRYHHLFAEVLRENLIKMDRSKMTLYCLRAAEWFSKNGLYTEAVDYAVKAGEYEMASDLLEISWKKEDRFAFSSSWMQRAHKLPPEIINKRPILMLNIVQAKLYLGRIEESERDLNKLLKVMSLVVEQVEVCPLPSEMNVFDFQQYYAMPMSICSIYAYLATAKGDMKTAIYYSKLMLEKADVKDISSRAKALAMQSFALSTLGELEEAFDTFQESMVTLKQNGASVEATIGTFVLGNIRVVQGRLVDALEIYENAIHNMESEGVFPQGSAFLYVSLSHIYREWGDQDIAKKLLSRSIEVNAISPMHLCLYRIALSEAEDKECEGDLLGALAALEKAENLHYRNVIQEFQSIPALKSRIWLKLENLSKVEEWVRKHRFKFDEKVTFAHEYDYIVYANYLLENYRISPSAEQLLQLKHLISNLSTSVLHGKRIGREIEVLMLEIQLARLEGKRDEAKTMLQKLILLAEPDGFMQSLVNNSKAIAPLLVEMQQDERLCAYGKKLARVIQKQRIGQPSYNSAAPLNNMLEEPLTKRELEVLRLIDRGLSNKEISEKLYIALSSVKGHNQSIFAKLGAKRRTEAISRARSISLI